ncbi:MAG: pilus assembly protein TadC [Bdellovibrionales bacterium CG10_big_fil_rev_8_21_14_0_10_45_34]|nr:MAG: pilus assembly protein TadC [Bdellovibrionales bacterium CG10_big_fil_rev_8_21_14_0_10_45_34]
MGELLLVIALLMLGLSVFLFVNSLISKNINDQALSWASGEEPTKSKSPFLELSRPLVHRFAIGLAQKVKSTNYRKSIELKINNSGLMAELNVDEFIGLQILWGVLFPFLVLFLNVTLELGYPPLAVVTFGAFGLYFPNLHTNTQRAQRVSSIQADLPFFIDLLALSTEAGLDFIGAIQRVVEKAEGSVLGQELQTTLNDIKLGASRAEALKRFAERVDLKEVTSFVTVLVDADQTGASIGKVLKDQAIQMRLERFARAEKAGARANQLILLPLLIFILPAVFIIVFGPIALQFTGQGG